MTTAAPLPNRLRETRQAADLSQADVAARVGISQGMVGRYELSAKNPPLDVMIRLADALGVDARTLFPTAANIPVCACCGGPVTLAGKERGDA